MTHNPTPNAPRIALCISGQPKSFETAFPYIKKNIIDCNQNVDIFLHTWYNEENVGKQFIGASNLHKGPENSTEKKNTPERLNELYKPIVAKIEPQEDFSKIIDEISLEIPSISVNPISLFSMLTSMKKSNDLKTQYEKEHNFTYDYVIRARYDTILPFKLNISKLERDMVHVKGWIIDNTVGVYDVFFVGSSKYMDIISDSINHAQKYIRITKLYEFESHLIRHLATYKIPTKLHLWFPMIIRNETAYNAIKRYGKNFLKAIIQDFFYTLPIVGKYFLNLRDFYRIKRYGKLPKFETWGYKKESSTIVPVGLTKEAV